MAKYRRRQLWVESNLQLGLAKELSVVLLMGAVLAFANVHMVGTFRDLFIADVSLASWSDSLLVWAYIVAMVGASVGMVFIVSAFYSHRIAGPAVKLTNHLDRMAAGELTARIFLRKHDHLGSIAAAINRVSARWRGTLTDMRNVCDELDELAEASDDDRLKQCAVKLRGLVDDAIGDGTTGADWPVKGNAPQTAESEVVARAV